MRFTVKLKILMAMTVAFLVALAVGAVGLDALEKTYTDVDNMYHQSLTPIIAVANVRSGILDIRTAIDRGLTVHGTDAAMSTRAQVDAEFASLDKEWTRYYPSMVNPGAEADQAHAFAGQLAELRGDTALVLDALAAGKADVAASTARDRLDPAYASATASIDRIVSLNGAEAAEGFAASAARHHATLVLVLDALAIGLASLAMASVLLIRAVIRPLRRASSLADTISRGVLGNALAVSGNDELSDTLRSLSAMEAQLTLIVGHVRDGAEQVAAAARTISEGSDDLSTRSQVQAAALEETAASMKEMTSSVRLNADGAEKARRLAITLRDDAKVGAKVAQDALDAMARVSAASRNIDDIAVVIEEIAFQTNLLALNAAVEAARAGAQGRGFAVVAAEVRELASRSAHATKDIKRLIAETRERVDEGAALVENTNTALNTIEVRAEIVADIVSEIAGTSQEQSAGIAQVSQAVNALDEVTQRNAIVVEQTSGASRHALMLSRDLLGEVSYFRQATAITAATPDDDSIRISGMASSRLA